MQRGTFIPGAPHLYPGAPHIYPPQALVSASTRGPSRTFQSQVNQPLPGPHAHGPADATVGASLDSLLSPLTWSSQELGHSLQALSASESQACPPASLRDPSSLNPRPALSLPQPLARQPNSHLPACLTLGCPCARCCLLPPGSGHILPVGRSAIALPVPLTCIPA